MMLKKSLEVFTPEDSSIVLGGEGQLLNGVPDQGLQLRQKVLQTIKKIAL